MKKFPGMVINRAVNNYGLKGYYFLKFEFPDWDDMFNVQQNPLPRVQCL